MQAEYITNLQFIAAKGGERARENDAFLRSLKNRDAAELDMAAHKINEEVSAAVDCTACGNCCNTLVINVAPDEIEPLAKTLNLATGEVRERYRRRANRVISSLIPFRAISWRTKNVQFIQAGSPNAVIFRICTKPDLRPGWPARLITMACVLLFTMS